MQYFKFNTFLISIKKQLVIRLTTGNLFIMNLSVAHINKFDNEDKLSLSPAGISSCEDSIPKPNAYSYTKFTAKVVNNKAIYFAATVSKKKKS